MSNEWRPAGSDLRAYYERRAPIYDDTVRKESRSEAAEVLAVIASMAPAKTLEIACGTGFLTASLPGDVVGLDQSASMLAQARRKVAAAGLVRGDALHLSFRAHAFARVATSFFYGHLLPPDRQAFLAEARRVAPEILVVDGTASGPGPVEEWEDRALADGRSYQIYSRRFSAEDLRVELGCGEPIFQGRWFVAVWAKAA